MSTLSSLVFSAICVIAAVASAGEPVLVQFHSSQCGPCNSMQPVVERLSKEGYPLQQVDVDQQPELARQYQVRSLPTFVLFDRSREVNRVEGPATFDQLSGMIHTTGFRPGTSANQVAAAQAAQTAAVQQPQPTTALQPTQFVSTPAAPQGRQLSPEQRAAWATVRLKVEDERGYGFGTGTIIDTHEDEALVLTCGHIFRQSQGKGKISVDLFAPGAASSIEGQVITYDLDRDVALVSIRPNIKIEAVPIAPADYAVAPRDRVFTVGCDKGADPSLVPSHVLQINRYQGAPNITVAGMPVGGRSGGGLFAENGMLIGVCNAADEKGNEGLYAALASVHWQLDQIGQSAIYRRTPGMQSNLATSSAAPPVMSANFEAPVRNLPRRSTPPEMASAALPAMPMSMPLSMPKSLPQTMPAMLTTAGAPQLADNDTEVIVIVRSRSNPTRQSEIFLMDRPTPEMLQQLQAVARPATAGTSADLLRHASQLGQSGNPARLDSNPIVRGQSQ